MSYIDDSDGRSADLWAFPYSKDGYYGETNTPLDRKATRRGSFYISQANSDADYTTKAVNRKVLKPRSVISRSTFASHFEALSAIGRDRDNPYPEEERPTKTAMELGHAILCELQTLSLEPSRIVASAEGGIAFCFIRGDKYSDIECLNSGAVLGVISNRTDRPDVWEIQPGQSEIARACDKIRAFILGTTAHEDASAR